MGRTSTCSPAGGGLIENSRAGADKGDLVSQCRSPGVGAASTTYPAASSLCSQSAAVGAGRSPQSQVPLTPRSFSFCL